MTDLEFEQMLNEESPPGPKYLPPGDPGRPIIDTIQVNTYTPGEFGKQVGKPVVHSKLLNSREAVRKELDRRKGEKNNGKNQ